jgi:hypothetical protein
VRQRVGHILAAAVVGIAVAGLAPAGSASAAPPSAPLGVSVRLNSFGQVTPTAPEHAAHPDLGLISAMATWASLEPANGEFDWTTMDANVEDARTGGYLILLRVMAGRLSPDWLAAEDVQTVRLLGTDINSVDYCSWLDVPVPWDPVLEQRYTELMHALGLWLQEPDGAGGTKGDHVFAISVAMPSFQGTEMNWSYGDNTTCPADTPGAGSNLLTTNRSAWNAISTEAERRAATEQAWKDAIDIHMQELPADVDSMIAYGALFGDQQAAALRIAREKVPQYPGRLWSMYTNLQPEVRADGSLGTYRGWCPLCHDVMMAVTGAHGLLGFQTASVRINDTPAKFHAAVEDGLATYGMRFLETQPDNVADSYPYLATDPDNVQARILATSHERATATSVSCEAVTVGATTSCTATMTDVDAGAAVTPSGAGTVTWSGSAGTFDAATCTPAGAGAVTSCSVTYTPAAGGPSQVSATYDGDSNHTGSDGATDLDVAFRATATSVSCSPGTTTRTCTATVTDTAGGAGSVPAGEVAWTSDGVGTFEPEVCTLGGGGSCSVGYTLADEGPDALTATYGGDAVHGGSAGGASVEAPRHATSTSVSCASPTTVGTAGTCTATVTDTDAGTAVTPGGTVGWSSAGGGAFSAPSCAASGSGASGSCSVTYTPSATGARTITASYGGDAAHTASAGSTQLTGAARTTSTSVSCSSPVVVGTGSSCTATVTDTAAGTKAAPAGGVTWSSSGAGTFSAATCAPANAAAQTCTATYTPTAAGSPTVTASYGGDATHGASAGGASLTVTAPAPPITLRSSVFKANANANTMVITKPAGVVAGDVLVAAIDVQANPTVTAPAGWTLVSTTANGANLTQRIYSKVAIASEPTSYQWIFNQKRPASGAILAYRNVSTSSPVHVVSAGIGTTTSITAPSATTSLSGTMVVGVFAIANNSAIAPPAGMTERGEVASSTKVKTEVADVLQPAAGATGAKTAVAGKAGANIGQLIVLRPAS